VASGVKLCGAAFLPLSAVEKMQGESATGRRGRKIHLKNAPVYFFFRLSTAVKPVTFSADECAH
jgi:hypothetical protein